VTAGDGAPVLEFAGISLPLPEAVAREHPALAGRAGRTVVLGVRAEDLTEAAPAEEARIPARVALRESVGSEVYVHFPLAAPPVLTEETREVAADLGVEVVGDLEERARTASTTWIARLPARSEAREGEHLQLRVDAAGLHLFDPETGVRI
jgi:multiple sugar transport system ATP-binding protein